MTSHSNAAPGNHESSRICHGAGQQRGRHTRKSRQIRSTHSNEKKRASPKAEQNQRPTAGAKSIQRFQGDELKRFATYLWNERLITDQEIAQIHARLDELAAERCSLERRLADLIRTASIAAVELPTHSVSVTGGSPPADTLALFRRLFAGRTDVFAVRWENVKAARSGHSPACRSELPAGGFGNLIALPLRRRARAHDKLPRMARMLSLLLLARPRPEARRLALECQSRKVPLASHG